MPLFLKKMFLQNPDFCKETLNYCDSQKSVGAQAPTETMPAEPHQLRPWGATAWTFLVKENLICKKLIWSELVLKIKKNAAIFKKFRVHIDSSLQSLDY